ncbi:MAG: class I SAM-dependent rRNA methyltransferase [Bacteroidetes bacterium]|nr:class I SAM-dependent rRNA methyltransferase [Bacteroidota bacterium]
MKSNCRIILKKEREKPVINFHPWIFSGAVGRIEGQPAEGDIVSVYSSANNFLSWGFYHEGTIKVRIFSYDPEDPNFDFWSKKLQAAFQARQVSGLTDNGKTNAYRLVNAEGDGFPGLIVDIYNDCAVLQFHNTGIFRLRNDIVKILTDLYGEKLPVIFDKSKDTLKISGKDSIPVNEFLKGNTGETVIAENGYSFIVNFEAGQKTGFYLDQRNNRKLIQDYCHSKEVLNAFAYSGGFSVYALKSGAGMVHSVDSSQRAVEWMEKNFELNGIHSGYGNYQEDVFDFFKRSDHTFDVIILDPPAFAKHLSAKNDAARAYQRLNFEALKKLRPGGILFTFSCSQIIDKKLFRQIIFAACAQAKRPVRILHQLTQPEDHPVNMYHPEGEYLKGLALYCE